MTGFIDDLGPGTHLLITHGGVIGLLLRRAGIERHVGPAQWVEL